MKALRHIRHCLDGQTASLIAHALISSPLDYANSILLGSLNYVINKLQRIQNSLARIVHQSDGQAFDKLEELLCPAADQPLSIINWDKPFNIHTDASDFMVAGILSQTGEDGNEYPTAFYSKKLSDTQRAWSTI